MIPIETSQLVAQAQALFRSRYTPDINEKICFGAAPGRIEILGNHTDYNEGFILSAAINRCTVVLGSISPASREIVLYSDALNEEVSFPIGDNTKYSNGQAWANYLKGVILQINPTSGFRAVIASNIPMGAGVSSSAAVELATAMFLQEAFDDPAIRNLSRLELALACKKAENDFVGMGCGILDQFTSAMAQPGKIIFLDCRDLQAARYIDFPPGYCFVIAESRAPHQLVDGKYNSLRSDCFEAAKILGVPFLRDIDVAEFEKVKRSLPDRLRKRASHIVFENFRVLRGFDVLKDSRDLAQLGTLMSESHLSSKNNFENSCREIDSLLECASEIPGFVGGRIQGGGFGGSTINLVESTKGSSFAEHLVHLYHERNGVLSKTLVVYPGYGAFSGKL